MKIRFAFLPDEGPKVDEAIDALRALFPGARLRESRNKPPYCHAFLTTKRPKPPQDTGETLDTPPPVCEN